MPLRYTCSVPAVGVLVSTNEVFEPLIAPEGISLSTKFDDESPAELSCV